ncbi:alpha/beta hydrolase [Vallitalea longa]|uniref:Alpha/beta hydrolase n=1 Tax=Vallitalea longa TaxID=2936439 RepID=A0A9W5Y9W4_9FIRM|nr:alpha/beta hydrolase [Vallitalea longa]GKX28059.1 alpha/beta hydrolase [Vallitalea longa]
MKKKLIKLSSVIFIVGALLIILVGFLLAFIPARMTKIHTDKIVKLYLNDMSYDIEDFHDKCYDMIQEDELITEDGHSIPIFYLLKENTYDNKTIVLVHWHESNHKAMYPIAEFFLEQDFNVVLYDARAHGDNTAKTVTFGYYEKEDLGTVIDYVNSKMTEDNIIGALGQSMGGATVGYYSGSNHGSENLDFAIIDSGYTSMYDEIGWQIDSFFIPMPTELLTKLGNLSNNQVYGYTYKNVSIVDAMKKSSIPTLIIHSEIDKKCPYYMGKELYEAIPHDNKRLVTFNNSKHLCAFWDEQAKYEEAIISFIDEYVN